MSDIDLEMIRNETKDPAKENGKDFGRMSNGSGRELEEFTTGCPGHIS